VRVTPHARDPANGLSAFQKDHVSPTQRRNRYGRLRFWRFSPLRCGAMTNFPALQRLMFAFGVCVFNP
jgi:hypothetical protein